MLKPIAIWNDVRGVWEQPIASLYCEHLELFSGTWPVSGMTLGGQAYELPMLELRTGGNGSSSLRLGTDGEEKLFQTPVAVEGDGGAVSAKVKEAKGHYVMLRDQIVDLVTLPTPTVGHIRNHDEDLEDYLQRREDYEAGRTSGMPGASLGVAIRLEQEGIDLFPTPNTMDSLPAREGEALERQLRRGVEGGSVRSTTGNLREDVMLLGTPRTSSANGSTRSQIESGATKGRLEDQVELLPTVTVSDNRGAASSEVAEGNPHRRLKVEVELLPTVLASEGTKQDTTITAEERIANGNQVALTNVARSGVDNPGIWGKYEPAIRRWEATLGRPAPSPTKPDGRDGAQRLSSVFTEWMMGLPEGWITNCGLTRNEELKLAGNGVVPQQAEIALRILLPKQLLKDKEETK